MIEKEVKKIAKLAKIGIEDKDLKKFCGQITQIVTMLQNLHNIDCEHLEPMYSPAETSLNLREDKIVLNNTKEDILNNAPLQSKEISQKLPYFYTPKVLD